MSSLYGVYYVATKRQGETTQPASYEEIGDLLPYAAYFVLKRKKVRMSVEDVSVSRHVNKEYSSATKRNNCAENQDAITYAANIK